MSEKNETNKIEECKIPLEKKEQPTKQKNNYMNDKSEK